MFRLYKGKTKTVHYPRPASTDFNEGDLVYFNESGEVIPADATSGDHVGVILRSVSSTDADYADSGVKVPVQVPVEDFVEFEVDTTGAVAADIGAEIDLTDAGTANRGASVKDALRVVRVISATKIVVNILSKATAKFTETT